MNLFLAVTVTSDWVRRTITSTDRAFLFENAETVMGFFYLVNVLKLAVF